MSEVAQSSSTIRKRIENLADNHVVRAGVTAIVASGTLLLAGCGSNNKANTVPAVPAKVESYLLSPQRNQRITVAADRAARVIITAEESHQKSPLGLLDASCGPAGDDGVYPVGVGGVVSEGYKPKPGDSCLVGHLPLIDGGEDTTIWTNINIDKLGDYYTNNIIVTIDDPKVCGTDINAISDDSYSGWVTGESVNASSYSDGKRTIALNAPYATGNPAAASTVPQAIVTDNSVIHCLDQAQAIIR